MVTVKQVSDGIARYVDNELVNKVGGIGKWLLAIASVKAITLAEELLEKHLDKAVKLGYATEDKMINTDELFNDLMRVAQEKGSVTEHLPVIGDVTFNIDDVQKLKMYVEG